MKYRVLWAPNADEQLDTILRVSTDRSVIAAAARIINAWLTSDPLNLGESRLENVRIAFKHPLGVEFEVLDDVKTVIVYEVWRTDRPR
jgi:hypothetical protein